MLTSPQSLAPPDGSSAFWIESPPHPLSASADVVASAASTACVRVGLIVTSFFLRCVAAAWVVRTRTQLLQVGRRTSGRLRLTYDAAPARRAPYVVIRS